MKVLIDECAPRALKTFLAKCGHECITVQEAGWSGKQNGELLTLAESRVDVLITLDTNLKYQQNLLQRRIRILVIAARSNRLADLAPYFSECASAIASIEPGQICVIGDQQ
jgi:predicted nuclease of predicted toxin-antitoxin system